MFSCQKATPLMSLEKAIIAFLHRVNDAFVSSHALHDLIYDSEYQRLNIKHGFGLGKPLGSCHLLPGYWFTVFVAPYEAFGRLRESVQRETNHLQESASEKQDEYGDHSLLHAINTLKHAYHNSLIKSVDEFTSNFEALIAAVDPLVSTGCDAITRTQSMKTLVASIATGSYEFLEDADGDMACTFYENDNFLESSYQATVKVGAFNKFCMDYVKQMADLVWPLVDGHKTIGEAVSGMMVADMLREKLK